MAATVRVAVIGPVGGQVGQEPCPLRGRFGADLFERRLEHVDPVLVDGAGGALDLSRVGQCGIHQGVHVAGLEGQASRFEQRVAVGEVAGLPQCVTEPTEELGPCDVRAPAVEGVAGDLVPLHGLARIQCGHGFLAGPVCIVHHGGGLVRPGARHQVAGEFGGGHGAPATDGGVVPLPEDVEHLAVEQRPTRGPEPLVEGPLDQGVREAVPPGPVRRLPHQGDGRRLLQRVEQVVGAGLGRGQDDVEVEIPTHHRSEGQIGRGHPTEPGDAGGDDLADSGGQTDRRRHIARCHPPAGVVAGERPDVEEVPEDLADEERVAVGLAMEGIGQGDARGVHGMAGQRLHHRQDPGRIEAGQVDAVHPFHPPEGAQGLDQRVRGGQLVVPERGHHDE